jgi:hypothetical protein
VFWIWDCCPYTAALVVRTGPCPLAWSRFRSGPLSEAIIPLTGGAPLAALLAAAAVPPEAAGDEDGPDNAELDDAELLQAVMVGTLALASVRPMK